MKTFDEFWAERGNHVAWADDRKDAARFVWDAAREGTVIDNEAAFDKLLGESTPAQNRADAAEGLLRKILSDPTSAPALRESVQSYFNALNSPRLCSHEFDCDQAGANYSIWRCRHCGTERRR